MLPIKESDKSVYPLISYPWPQFRYKTRVYKQTNLDEKQLAKLHTKVSVPDTHPPPAVPRAPSLSPATIRSASALVYAKSPI